MSAPRLRFTEFVPLLLAVAIPIAAVVAAAGPLACLPLLALTLPLLLGRYPAVETLVRRAARARAKLRRRSTSPSARPGLIRSTLPRGGRLIAAGLAKRPPPAAPSLP